FLMICSGVCRRLLCPIAPIVLLAHRWAVRLSQRPDRSQGVTSASLSPRERLRLALPERYAVALERLDEVLNGPDPEAALVQWWKAVDQAYGKPTEHVDVRAGPIPPEELETWSDERVAARIKELKATTGQESTEKDG
ncbi:MAG: hypothetical protein ACE5FA_12615, partial [Dehalococcoidia bacterium]